MGLLPPLITELRANVTDFTAGLSKAHGELDKLAAKGATTGQKLQSALGQGFMVGGAAIAGAGAIFEKFGERTEASTKALDVAIKNTGNSASEFAGRIDQTQQHMEHYGHTVGDTNSALQKLTQATQSPSQALKEMSLVNEIAATKHVSLSEAADKVVKMHAGSAKAFKEFGMNVSLAGNASKAAAEAETKHAEASKRLQDTQQALADFEARTAASRSQAQEQAATRITAADQRVEAATQRVAEVNESVAERIKASQESAKQSVESAVDAQESAQERLADLLARQAAHQKDLLASGSTDSEETKVSQAQELKHAQEEVDKATQKRTQAEQDAAKASQLTTAEINQQKAALAEQAKAEAEQKAAKDAATKAGQLTVSQQQEERKLRDAVTAATEKEAETQQDMAKKQADAADSSRVLSQAMDELGRRLAGQADAAASTFGGHIAGVRAHLEDMAGSVGTKVGPAMMLLGPTMMGVSSVISSGLIPTIGAFAGMAVTSFAEVALAAAPVVLPLIAIGVAAYELYTHWDTVWGFIKHIAAEAYDWIKGHIGLVMTVVLGPLGLAIYELATHWSEVWGAMKTVVVDVAGALVDVFKAPFNAIAWLWNNTIGQLSFHVPSWVPGIGGDGFDVPKIPMLAKGGIVTKPTLALIGENGPEEVRPLGSSSTTHAAPQVPQGDLVLQVDGETFGRIAWEQLLKVNKGVVTLGLT